MQTCRQLKFMFFSCPCYKCNSQFNPNKLTFNEKMTNCIIIVHEIDSYRCGWHYFSSVKVGTGPNTCCAPCSCLRTYE